MQCAVVVLNFGEPAEPTLESVVAYLERIFDANATLEDHGSEEARRERSRALARRRAPGLLEEYREIGGSPLDAQARAQADALERELSDRGLAARTYVGMQYTEPTIGRAVERALGDGAERLIGLPAYPLCGRSTNVAALAEMAEAVEASGAVVHLREVGGWHRHPGYLDLRIDAIRRHVAAAGVTLADPATRLVFSAHGTPIRYLDEGNRYDRYVDEWCRTVARRLGVARYTLGFQNHGNRAIEWTQPEIETAVAGLPEEGVERVVVDPVSFMHEQSETLAELDGELREAAEEAGLAFHRVPIPWDDPSFASVLADLVEPLVTGHPPEEFHFGECRCRPGAACLNAVEQPVFASEA